MAGAGGSNRYGGSGDHRGSWLSRSRCDRRAVLAPSAQHTVGITALPRRTRRREGVTDESVLLVVAVGGRAVHFVDALVVFCVLLRAVTFCDLCVLLLLQVSRARAGIADGPTGNRQMTPACATRARRSRGLALCASRVAWAGVDEKEEHPGMACSGRGVLFVRTTAGRSVRHGLSKSEWTGRQAGPRVISVCCWAIRDARFASSRPSR